MSANRAYGCLFCATGREESIVGRIAATYTDVRAIVARREKVQKINGFRCKRTEILLPSYVFFETSESFNPYECLHMNGVIRVLVEDRNMWQLQGKNRGFAEWLFMRDGLLGTSVALKENDTIRIVDGPMKDMEGKISKLDRHSRRGRVDIDFDGHVFSVWLSFDIVESVNEAIGRGESEIEKKANASS